MPPRKGKEAKETVVYPASKRKAPPFKPQRPSQVSRIATTESENSIRPTTKPAKRPVGATTNSKATRKASLEADGSDSENGSQIARSASSSDSDDELGPNPLAAMSKTKSKQPSKPATAKRKAPLPDKDAMSISSDEGPPKSSPPHSTTDDAPPAPTQLSDPTSIPQPLLIRLLHEHFSESETKIDKHAVRVLQKYLEVFVREAIARTAMQKREAVARGEGDADDAG
ncbi:hypothetical protein LTR53_016319, partial [Teratosphaeriaceae sp. CCFEE 6253]